MIESVMYYTVCNWMYKMAPLGQHKSLMGILILPDRTFNVKTHNESPQWNIYK